MWHIISQDYAVLISIRTISLILDLAIFLIISGMLFHNYTQWDLSNCNYFLAWDIQVNKRKGKIETNKNLDKFIRAAFHQNRHITRDIEVPFILHLSYKFVSMTAYITTFVILWELLSRKQLFQESSSKKKEILYKCHLPERSQHKTTVPHSDLARVTWSPFHQDDHCSLFSNVCMLSVMSSIHHYRQYSLQELKHHWSRKITFTDQNYMKKY